MPLDVNIDDNNTTLILYQGSWTYRPGSTRQWEGGVHATDQAGASAAFNFRGTVWILGTIPAGAGTNVITVSIDGDTSSNISRTSNGSAVYDEVYFASPWLRDTFHTIVVINRGSISSGNSEFMLDRFEFQTDDEVPAFSTFPSATSISTSSSSSKTSSSSPSPSSSSSTTPWGAVIGAIVSCLFIIIFILLFIIWRKWRSPNNTIPGSTPLSPFTPTPYPASSELSTSENSNRRILPTILSEKISYQQSGSEPANTPSTAITLSPSASAGPSPLPPSSAAPLLVDPLASLSENYDGPPPSYQQKSAA